MINIIIDVLGMLAFAGAAFYAYKNHEKMQQASNLWLYFGTACLMALLWGASLIMKELGMAMIAGFEPEPALFFAVIFMYTLVSMTSMFDFVKLQGRLKR